MPVFIVLNSDQHTQFMKIQHPKTTKKGLGLMLGELGMRLNHS